MEPIWTVQSAGASSAAARRRAALKEPCRTLPAIPRIVTIGSSYVGSDRIESEGRISIPSLSGEILRRVENVGVVAVYPDLAPRSANPPLPVDKEGRTLDPPEF